jgi:hypothetical protein
MINFLKGFFKKKKKTVSITEFHNQLKLIADNKKETYYQVRVTIGSSPCMLDETYGAFVIYDAYINGTPWVRGKTIEECLRKMEAVAFPATAPKLQDAPTVEL